MTQTGRPGRSSRKYAVRDGLGLGELEIAIYNVMIWIDKLDRRPESAGGLGWKTVRSAPYNLTFYPFHPSETDWAMGRFRELLERSVRECG